MVSRWKKVADRLEVRPMSGRSLVLTTLLGSHPPRLPPQALVAVGALFGVPAGTIRTALSRMATEGELVALDGRYGLSDAFAMRQRALDAGRRPRREAWDGSWWSAVVLSERRPLADRRAFRAEMARALMGELRPDVWLRPANLPVPVMDPGVLLTSGHLGHEAGRDLAATLWDLDRLERSLRHLIEESVHAAGLLGSGDHRVLAESFIVSVAIARALGSEPQLPDELVGSAWPADELRRRYDELEARHGQTLHEFLRSVIVQD